MAASLLTGLFIKPTLVLAGCFFFLLLSLAFKKNRQLAAACLGCCLLVGGAVHHWQKQVALPSQLVNSTQLLVEVQVDTIEVNGDLVRFVGRTGSKKLQCRLPLASQEQQAYWQTTAKTLQLRVTGHVEAAQEQHNLWGFDYRRYLETQGIAGILTITSWEVEQVRPNWTFHSLRRWLLLYTDRILPAKIAAYSKSMILGVYSRDFAESREIFSASGLLYLFSLSGLHVRFLLSCCYYLFRRCGLTKSQSFLPLSGLSCCCYLISGSSAVVARVLLTFLVGQFLALRGWLCSGLDRFSLSVLGLLLLQPYVFFSSAGALSVLLALLFLLLQEQPGRRLIKICRFQVSVAPFILSSFYRLPLLGSWLGGVLLPVVQYGLLPLLFGLLAVGGPSFSRLLAVLTALVEWLLGSLESVLMMFQGLTVSGSSIGQTAVLCLLLLAVYYLQGPLISRKKRYCCCLLLLFPCYQKYLDPTAMIAFIDVGQGDSIFFKAPFSQETILLDTGGRLGFSKEPWQQRQLQSGSDYDVIPFLRSQGVSRLDKLILTHADEDHMGEAMNISRQIPIKELYLAKGVEENPKLAELLTYLTAQGTQLKLVTQGAVIGAYFQLQVLSPDQAVVGENNDSLVLWSSAGARTWLFTGDLEQAGEQHLLQSYPQLQADILKVGHHGSQTSSSPAFIQQLQPQIAVISCGKDNRFGHPHEVVLQQLAQQQIYRTDQMGMIYFSWSFYRPQAQARTVKLK